jgi:hypothetical protein
MRCAYGCVAERREPAHVVEPARACQRMAGRGGGEIVADELHADREAREPGVVEGMHAFRARAVDEDVARAVIGARVVATRSKSRGTPMKTSHSPSPIVLRT